MNTTLQRPDSDARVWRTFAALLVTLIILAAVRWMLGHPYAVHADEAWYVNEAQIDLQIFHVRGPIQLARWMVHGDGSRPPAYRLILLPFTALLGYHTLIARLLTLACFAMSGWFIYMTTRRLVSPAAGALAALVFCLSPDILQASTTYSTEGPLYLAIAGTLYFLSTYWTEGSKGAGNWIGLGLALGLGLLSKTTFVFVAGPAFLFSVLITARDRGSRSGLISLIKAGTLGVLVAAPWWLKNIRPAFAYAKYASRGFPRHSLGAHSFATIAQWLGNVCVSLLGPGTAILIGAIVIARALGILPGKATGLSSVQRAVLIACACAIAPLLIVQLSGTNYLLRHISPVVIPFAIGVEYIVCRKPPAGSIPEQNFSVLSGLLFVAQFLMAGVPCAGAKQA